jgi:hypothetical protein
MDTDPRFECPGEADKVEEEPEEDETVMPGHSTDWVPFPAHLGDLSDEEDGTIGLHFGGELGEGAWFYRSRWRIDQ